jgi:hypothetical protein
MIAANSKRRRGRAIPASEQRLTASESCPHRPELVLEAAAARAGPRDSAPAGGPPAANGQSESAGADPDPGPHRRHGKATSLAKERPAARSRQVTPGQWSRRGGQWPGNARAAGSRPVTPLRMGLGGRRQSHRSQLDSDRPRRSRRSRCASQSRRSRSRCPQAASATGPMAVTAVTAFSAASADTADRSMSATRKSPSQVGRTTLSLAAGRPSNFRI